MRWKWIKNVSKTNKGACDSGRKRPLHCFTGEWCKRMRELQARKTSHVSLCIETKRPDIEYVNCIFCAAPQIPVTKHARQILFQS